MILFYRSHRTFQLYQNFLLPSRDFIDSNKNVRENHEIVLYDSLWLNFKKLSFLKILTLSLTTSNATLTLLTLYWKANITRNARLHKLYIFFYEKKFEIHIMQIWNLNLLSASQLIVHPQLSSTCIFCWTTINLHITSNTYSFYTLFTI